MVKQTPSPTLKFELDCQIHLYLMKGASFGYLWKCTLILYFKSTHSLMHMKSGKEGLSDIFKKTPLGEGSLIRNLSFTKFTTEYDLLTLSNQNLLSTHTCQTLGLHKWVKLVTQSTIKQLTTMETHRMPGKQVTAAVCYPWGGILGCRKCSRSKPEFWNKREGCRL